MGHEAVICPSCGGFILADNPKACPRCGADLEHFVFPTNLPGADRSNRFSWAAGDSEGAPMNKEPDIAALEFRRSGGPSYGGPRKYIDKRLPRCPFCRSSEPLWEQAVVTGWLNRANFRCQKCSGILSVPLQSLKSGPSTLFGALRSPEYLRVERVGSSPGVGAVEHRIVGGEFSLDRLKAWADRAGDELLGLAA